MISKDLRISRVRTPNTPVFATASLVANARILGPLAAAARMRLQLEAENLRFGAGSLFESLSSRAERRWELQPVFLSDLNHARNVVLLLRTQRTDFLKEPFETRRRDDAHEPARCVAEVTISVRYPARRENRRALLRDECFPADGPFVFAFEDLKCLVLPVVDVRRRAAAGHVVRLDGAHHPAGVSAVDANGHGNAKDVYFVTAVVGNLDRVHVWKRDCGLISFCGLPVPSAWGR